MKIFPLVLIQELSWEEVPESSDAVIINPVTTVLIGTVLNETVNKIFVKYSALV